MRYFNALRAGSVFAAALCLCAQAPSTETPSIQGIPPRATPGDYQFKAAAGSLTIAAEFLGHSVPTAGGTYLSEDYVVVEVAIFGAAGARTTLSFNDFSIRLNGKKAPSPATHFGLIFGSLKDPEWVPPNSEGGGGKSKTSLGGSGRGANDPPPVPPKMPIALRRAMEQRVQKSALPEGDRPLPQAGLIFFPHRGKAENIHSIELIYSGPDGKATLSLQ